MVTFTIEEVAANRLLLLEAIAHFKDAGYSVDDPELAALISSLKKFDILDRSYTGDRSDERKNIH